MPAFCPFSRITLIGLTIFLLILHVWTQLTKQVSTRRTKHSAKQTDELRMMLGTLRLLSPAVSLRCWSQGWRWPFAPGSGCAGSNGPGTSSPACCSPAPPPERKDTASNWASCLKGLCDITRTCSFSRALAAMLAFLKLMKAQKRSWRTRMLSISPNLQSWEHRAFKVQQFGAENSKNTSLLSQISAVVMSASWRDYFPML